MIILYENDVFPILVLSTKKRYSSVEKGFFFQKICFESIKSIESILKVLKTFETFNGCRIKTCQSLKREAILKIWSIVL